MKKGTIDELQHILTLPVGTAEINPKQLVKLVIKPMIDMIADQYNAPVYWRYPINEQKVILAYYSKRNLDTIIHRYWHDELIRNFADN